MPLKRKPKIFEIFQKNFEKPIDKPEKMCYNRIMESTKECKPNKTVPKWYGKEENMKRIKPYENFEMYKANPYASVSIYSGLHYKCNACKCYCKPAFITGWSDSIKACAWCVERIAKRKSWTYEQAKKWVMDVSTEEHYQKEREREEEMQIYEDEE